ncbi:MAG: aldose epimerase family protein, partial [Oscillospiraceae bacterium]
HLGGQEIVSILLQNQRGMSVELLSLGAAIRRLTVLDRDDRPVDVCLGYDTAEEYLEQDGHLGGVIGRYANRIGKARLSLDGAVWPLTQNEGENHLHGGRQGFDRAVWAYAAAENSVVFSLDSPHLDEGYPGNLHVEVTYRLRDSGRLELEYRAVSDRNTVVSLTNHSYFNLSGHASGEALDHLLTLEATRYTPCGEGNIPTGELLSVAGTALDFRTAVPIGRRIGDPILASCRGYDHNYAPDGQGLRRVARLSSPVSGISMDVETDMEGLQLYTANFLSARRGKGGAAYGPHHAVCLETQCFPDAMHHPAFPSPVLRAGALYHRHTAYCFETAALRQEKTIGHPTAEFSSLEKAHR